MPDPISCSYDSSGGDIPQGYCVWQHGLSGQHPTLLACHCASGYVPLSPGPASDQTAGTVVKTPCIEGVLETSKGQK